jgi:hypothetical protein
MLAAIGWQWRAGNFAAPASVLPIILAGVIGAIGLQTIFGGFMIAIIGGHSADFVRARGQLA